MRCEKCSGPMESITSVQVRGELVGDGAETEIEQGRQSVECNLVCQDCGHTIEDDAVELDLR